MKNGDCKSIYGGSFYLVFFWGNGLYSFIDGNGQSRYAFIADNYREIPIDDVFAEEILYE